MFAQVSGLQINLSKSTLFGIGVSPSTIDSFASNLGCQSGHLPFIYLGLPVGANMAQTCSWKPVIEKFKSKLSFWKSHLLSTGGRLTMLKSVLGSMPLFFFSLFRAPVEVTQILESMRSKFFWGLKGEGKGIYWVNWETVLSDFDQGGLGVGSLKGKNWALIGKWKWRFLVENEALWVQVIREFYGAKGGMEGDAYLKIGGVWGRILKTWKLIDDVGVDFSNSFEKNIGDGKESLFWEDKWLGGKILKICFPRLAKLETVLHCTVAERGFWSSDGWCWDWKWRRNPRGRELGEFEALTNLLHVGTIEKGITDSWSWKLDHSMKFTVVILSSYIDKPPPLCPYSDHTTYWLAWVPKKLNIFLWKAALDRLPTLPQLHRRGVVLQSLACPRGCTVTESLGHCLVSCTASTNLWSSVYLWCDLGTFSGEEISDILFTTSSRNLSKNQNKVWLAIRIVTAWCIWRDRNSIVFNNQPPSQSSSLTLSSIQFLTFLWLSSRWPRFSSTWSDWIINPLGSIANL